MLLLFLVFIEIVVLFVCVLEGGDDRTVVTLLRHFITVLDTIVLTMALMAANASLPVGTI